MDRIAAKDLDHKAIALNVYEELDGTIDQLGWWTQAVTVAYEQYIGRRIPGQRPDGTFQTSVSRSTTFGMDELMTRWQKFAANDVGLCCQPLPGERPALQRDVSGLAPCPRAASRALIGRRNSRRTETPDTVNRC